MNTEFRSSKSIPLVWGIGLAIIGIGYLFLFFDPSWPGWINYGYEKMYLGQWVQLIGTCIAIFAIPLSILRRQKRKEGRVHTARMHTARAIAPEKAENFFDKYSSWQSILIFGAGGIVGYTLVTELASQYPLLEIPFGLSVIFGFSLGLWRLVNG